MRPALSRTASLLVRATAARAARARGLDRFPEPGLRLCHCQEQDWASLTFSGVRLEIELALDVPPGAADAIVATLADWPEAEWPVQAGHVLTELEAVVWERQMREDGCMSLGLRLAALSIEE